MNTSFSVIGLTRHGIEPQVYRSRGRRSYPIGHLIGSFVLIPQNRLFQIMSIYSSSLANLLLSNLQATVLQDIVSSLRLAIHFNPETINYLRFSYSRII